MANENANFLDQQTAVPLPLAVQQPTMPIGSAEWLIARAIEEKVPIETMERLLAMRKELKAERAREDYFAALSAFQSECPIITKTKEVMNKDGRTVRYRYAPLDTIVATVGPLLQRHGFSYRIDTKVLTGDPMGFLATCSVYHSAGHSEPSEFLVPIMKSDHMNQAQQYATAGTYAKRYAFCNAFGILTGDEDTDASDGDETFGEVQVLALYNLIKTSGVVEGEEKILRWMDRLARTLGHDTLIKVPLRLFETCKAQLEVGIKAAKEKAKPTAG